MARNALTPFGGSYGRDPFTSLQREMNRLFDDTFRGFGAQHHEPTASIVEARMNVSENDKEIRVTAELPGVSEKDVDITLDGELLTIRGEKKFEHEQGGEKDSYHFVERSYGTFQRTLRLPFAVNPDEVRADFQNGVLTLTMPKPSHEQRSRKIQIGKGAEPQATPPGDAGKKPSGDQPVAH